jgi:hypothetical protein
MNPPVTKPQGGAGTTANELLVAPARASHDSRGAAMASLRIIGRRLPGEVWSGRTGIHLGVQRGTAEVVNLISGDAGEAVFDLEVEVTRRDEGDLDFKGPFVQGRRGERFVYLSWGEVDATGTFAMFRRLKLHLSPLAEQFPDELATAKRIQAVLELSDTRGRPLAASVRPPWVTWRLGFGSR